MEQVKSSHSSSSVQFTQQVVLKNSDLLEEVLPEPSEGSQPSGRDNPVLITVREQKGQTNSSNAAMEELANAIKTWNDLMEAFALEVSDNNSRPRANPTILFEIERSEGRPRTKRRKGAKGREGRSGSTRQERLARGERGTGPTSGIAKSQETVEEGEVLDSCVSNLRSASGNYIWNSYVVPQELNFGPNKKYIKLKED